jgi:hypothetical protein
VPTLNENTTRVFLLVYQDQAGSMRATNIAADFVYHVPSNAKWIMRGGVRTGFLNVGYVFENPISQISKISHKRMSLLWNISLNRKNGLMNSRRKNNFERGEFVFFSEFFF